MRPEGSLLITSAVEDPFENLSEISRLTSQRMEEIGTGILRRSTLIEMDDRLFDFTEKIEQTPLLEGEDAAQRSERLGWMAQSAALAMLSKEGVGADAVKDGWRTELGMEILERRRLAGGSLPGISVKFREPYEGYIDGWSTNVIQIEFTEKLEETDEYPLTLPLRHTDVFALSGPQRTQELIAGYEKLEFVGTLTALTFLTEIVDVLHGLKVKSPEYTRDMLDIRLRLLTQLVKNDPRTKYALEVHHLVVGAYGQYHALLLKLKRTYTNQPIYYAVNTQLQPEDVTDDTIWEYLAGLNVEHHSVPSRLECKRLAERVRDSDESGSDYNDDDDGGRSGKRSHGWKRRGGGRRYGGN